MRLRKIYGERVIEVERLLNYQLVRKFNYNNPIEILHDKCFALMNGTQLMLLHSIKYYTSN